MSQHDIVTIYTDGASRGNPGPAAYGYVIKRPSGGDIEANGRLPDTTNNVAEYMALIKALEHTQRIGARNIAVFTDSELMAKQVSGSYRVKNVNLRPLYERVCALWDQFDSATIRHVPRGENAQADRLCNEALDQAGKAPKTQSPVVNAAKKENIDDEAIECLRIVAAAWARGNPNHPKPEEVWEQLWTILEDAGVVRVK